MISIYLDYDGAYLVSLTPEQQQEIQQLQEASYPTRRATVPALEEILYQAFPVLDHGFVRVIDYMGGDSAIVQAARVSYGRGTKKVNEDQGLINYLLRHRHTTPFEMCEIKFHIKLPFFIARQWIRHRTANINEYSGRYSILDKEFYIPAPENLAAQSSSNRQGRGQVLEGEYSKKILKLLQDESERAYDSYDYMLNENEKDPERFGVARELARMSLPLNFYTQMYWKIDLHNLLHFLSLRTDSHSQYEIRVYADVMVDILKRWVPFTHQAFMDYRVGGTSLSAKAMQVIKRKINGEAVTQESSGMGPREWRELVEVLEG
jgi:thymidylate synthase (FAD)